MKTVLLTLIFISGIQASAFAKVSEKSCANEIQAAVQKEYKQIIGPNDLDDLDVYHIAQINILKACSKFAEKYYGSKIGDILSEERTAVCSNNGETTGAQNSCELDLLSALIRVQQ